MTPCYMFQARLRSPDKGGPTQSSDFVSILARLAFAPSRDATDISADPLIDERIIDAQGSMLDHVSCLCDLSAQVKYCPLTRASGHRSSEIMFEARICKERVIDEKWIEKGLKREMSLPLLT